MGELAKQQQALLAALLAWPPHEAEQALAELVCHPWARGLMAYQANGHALAVRALGAAYPVLAQLLGADSFASLARAYWHAEPPVRGDVGRWGATLAGFLAGSEQLEDEPYLGDVARVEWALHQCASAADVQVDASTFPLLMEGDPQALALVLAPGCALVTSIWPVASVMTAHLEAAPELHEVGRRLAAGVAETALVWRRGLRPCVRQAWPGEAEWIQATLAGHAVGAALDRAADLDFNAWLPMAVRSGLLLSVRSADLASADFKGVLS
jgi:hypothetical protein